jgi:TonB-linked SusC/RagA family outer membrane protein
MYCRQLIALIFLIMKLTFVQILLVFILSVNAYGNPVRAQDALNKKVSIKAVNEEFRKVLIELQKLGNVKFVYSSNFVPVSKKISLQADNRKLSDVLDSMLIPLHLRYEVDFKNIISLHPSHQQTNGSKTTNGVSSELFQTALPKRTITGKVLNADGSPLSGASVIIKGGTKGTTTDADGNFTIIIADKDVLLVSFAGFISQQITTKEAEVLIKLIPQLQNLEDVVVVGYGTQKKKDITGSVVSVPKDRLENLPNTNFQQALQGAMPGIRVTTNSNGAEGNGSSILIRGRNSITAGTGPFIILDGIPYTGGMSEINPNDLESIDVLKDASAAAIYGAKAAGGVIILTTKQGKRGKTAIVYDALVGQQIIANKPNLLSGAEFYEFKKNRANVPGAMTPSEEAVYTAGNWVDWYDLATRKGSRNQHSISISGASEKSKHYFNATYLNVNGIAKNDRFNRYSLRSNVEYKVAKGISVGSNALITIIDRGGLAADFSGQNGANFMNPLTTPYNEDGSIKPYAWPENNVAGNPLSNLVVKNEDKAYRILLANNIKIEIPFIKGLSYKFNTGVEVDNTVRRTYYGRNSRTGLENGGQAINFNAIQRNFTIENIINYNRDFKQHSIGITALYSAQSEDGDRDQLTGIGFSSDVLTNYQMNQASLLSVPASTSGTTYKRNTLSQMLRLNYGYLSKYLITLTARRDGFSSFGTGTKYGIFPAAAIGWNLSKENWIQQFSVINALKLRVSYGLNGNSSVPAYAALANFRARNYVTGSMTPIILAGNIPATLANDILGWESSKVFNVGLDFSILKDHISGSIEFYDKSSKDLILRRSISPVHGFNSITQNIGKVANNGLEISLNTANITKKNFSWTSNMNISFNNNKIVDLYGDGKDDINNQWFIGQPININYGYRYDGIFQTGDDLSQQPGAQAGYVKIVDVNKDKVIDVNDRTIIGSSDPKVIWGINNTLKYKNVTLNIFVHGVGNIVKENPLEQDAVFSNVSRNTTKKNWWTATNPSTTHWANDANANRLGVNIYEDASFIRLKDITLGYDLPQGLLKKYQLAKLKVFVSARNLATITQYKGLDPEISNQLDIPLQREYSLGINLGL